jgi:hypothetical protein
METINYYRTLKCDSYSDINQQILTHLLDLNFIDSTNEFWNPINIVDLFRRAPLFQTWLQDSNLKIKSVAVTVGKQLNCCGIHIDTPPARYKLSWPVLNTHQSYNRWFKELVNDCTCTTNSLGGKIYQDESQLEEVARMTVTAPTLIDAGVPHDVQFFTDTPLWPRVGLQCQLFNEPKSL